MLARRFLYIIAALIVLVLIVGLGWSLFQDRLMRMAFVPTVDFKAMPDATAPDYTKPAAWLSRPGAAADPALYVPAGHAATKQPRAAVFYVPPTTYLAKDRWNGPLDDEQANYRLGLFARSQASVFNGVGQVWAPRYRQATFGAFLAAHDPRAQQAVDFAYGDVVRAFDAFITANPRGPIILAGHSQGSLHLLRLLRDVVAGTAIRPRIVAVYAIGWPISLTADLPALGLPGCTRAGETGCIVSWQSFAEPAEPKLIDAYFEGSTGYAGLPRAGTKMLCVNPITGARDQAAPITANRGALVPEVDLSAAELKPNIVPARCSERGLLLIGGAPKGFGMYVLPGNNFHVFDYALFWADVRADAQARLEQFLAGAQKR